MSNYDPKMRDPDYNRSPMTANRMSSGSWIAGAVVVVLLLIAVGYVFSNRTTGNMVEHRAAAVDSTTPAAPSTPANTPAAAPSAPAAAPDKTKP